MISMTDDNGLFGSESRRSFVKKGALAGSALALGASGSAAAQTDDDGTPTTPTDTAEEVDAVVQVSNFHPNGRFNFTSSVIDWTPTFPGVANDAWANYNTYMIRWLNTNEMVPLWVEQDANIEVFPPQAGFIPDEQDPENQIQLYEMDPEMESFEDSDDVVQVGINPVSEEEAENIRETDDFYDDQQGEGTPTPTETTTGNETGT